MIPGEERRSFLLSVTLTELLLLLFFLLLLTAVWHIYRVERETTRLKNQLSGMEKLLTDNAGSDLEGILAEIRAAAEDTGALIALRNRVQALEEENSGLKQLIAQRIEADEDDEDFTELIRAYTAAAQENSQLREAASELEQQRDSLQEQLERSTEQTANLRAQIVHIQGQGKGGLDFPPCWVDRGKVEYIFTVVLQEERFSVLPAWPARREADLDEITGARELLKSNLSRDEFARLAEPILKWSKDQDPECRHYVRINDAATMSKTAFKANLLLVEDFFYKYLPSDARGL